MAKTITAQPHNARTGRFAPKPQGGQVPTPPAAQRPVQRALTVREVAVLKDLTAAAGDTEVWLAACGCSFCAALAEWSSADFAAAISANGKLAEAADTALLGGSHG